MDVLKLLSKKRNISSILHTLSHGEIFLLGFYLVLIQKNVDIFLCTLFFISMFPHEKMRSMEQKDEVSGKKRDWRQE